MTSEQKRKYSFAELAAGVQALQKKQGSAPVKVRTRKDIAEQVTRYYQSKEKSGSVPPTSPALYEHYFDTVPKGTKECEFPPFPLCSSYLCVKHIPYCATPMF